jgi:hypothetical protein
MAAAAFAGPWIAGPVIGLSGAAASAVGGLISGGIGITGPLFIGKEL